MSFSTEYEIQNARIESASIRFDRGTFLSIWLGLDYGGTGQGFGGFVLGAKTDGSAKAAAGNREAYAALFIVRVMEIAGVDDWSDLVGKTIRAEANHSNVRRIGHILKDDWFCPSEEFEKLNAAQPQGDGE